MYPAQTLCLYVTMIPAPSLAMAASIATIKKLGGNISITRKSKAFSAILGTCVHQDDPIVTGSQGHIGLEAVREDLIEIGVGPDTIRTYYKGESEPLIDTGDGVKEQRNRRVEINVR